MLAVSEREPYERLARRQKELDEYYERVISRLSTREATAFKKRLHKNVRHFSRLFKQDCKVRLPA